MPTDPAPPTPAARVDAVSCPPPVGWTPDRLIVGVVGPTASGKSDLALDLAETLPGDLGATGAGEIVGADALQLYRGMDIGTAKTPVDERRGIAHHQIDVLDVLDEASVARYQDRARSDIRAIHSRGAVAVVAGGSGLYQRALLDVIDFPGTDPRVRARLEDQAAGPLGPRGLHERLALLDPASAERIDPRNARRIIRALEVIEITGRPYSAHMPDRRFAAPAIMVAPRHDLDALDDRIARRTRAMFDKGLVEETRGLVDRGLRRAKTASKATGYAQALAVIDGRMSVDEAIDSVALATRQLARRQIKWLRPDPRVVWIDASGRDPGRILAEARAAVREAADAHRRTHGAQDSAEPGL
ncbi:tRNA (adenosine(37)-N6)-dimethylallyltransferase MiaA [Actinomyces sp. B33]|uniref:tRNA (adenosine(37)-N6)-dimethylallyltransferase MiaA n=1 Tax=Actinomyces sp. B33 TaxID=2942131 RepID=UPI0023405249|nr:tRNA (adenosine(37)-N6)-dimethylallyltransferase MiaA [Actinomyces sp. B33]MDC4233059.1 tRNA (adenosine(37)-N6)-dimethylallyltransferase MiaA [Actinomyces sp. B33]